MYKIFNFKEFPIKKKLIAIIVFISFIVLFISSTSFFTVQYTTTESNETKHIKSITTMIAKNITAALVFKDLDAANEMLSSLQSNPTIKQAVVLDAQGRIFSKFRADGPRLDLDNILKAEETSYHDNLLIVKKPVVLEGRNIGTVIIADDLQDLKQQLLTYVVVAVGVLIASMLIALILSAELQHIITSPISQLSEIAEKVTNQENYSYRAHKTSNDEIGNLIDNFNKMISKIGIQNREMKKLNLELEDRVRHRTAELQDEINARRQTEASLRLAQYSVDRSSDCIYWIDPDARFVYVNDAASGSLGYAKKELLTMSIFDIDPIYDEQKWKEAWQLLKKKSSLNVESVHKRKDGTTFPVEILANYIEYEGKEYNFAFVRDITERKKTEDELKSKIERLKNKNVINIS